MTTFSQLVDYLVDDELRRPDLRTAVASYMNHTIQQLHNKDDGSFNLFDRNRNEVEITVDATPYVWPFPTPSYTFQKIEAVWHVNRGIYLEEKTPKAVFANSQNPLSRYNWYQSGPTIVINGVIVGDLLTMSYFAGLPRLAYYSRTERPATYDAVTGAYAILDSWAGTDQEALDASTNWMLQTYADLILEGVRAKVYRRINSVEQAKMAYASFQADRRAITVEESN